MANPEHLAILKQGVEVWNKWRREAWKIVPDLSEANLRDADLSGACLSNTNLSGADLSRAKLREAILSGVNFSKADLREVNLSGIDLSGMDLSEVNLHEANLMESRLSSANLSKAYLGQAKLCKADLSFANLMNAHIHEADLRKAHLMNVWLSFASLTDSDLRGAYMYSAKLTYTSLVRAKLQEANLTKADMEMANLKEANFSEANLSEANLGGANLSDANFSEANLSEANLSGANLNNSDFTNTKLIKVNLNRASFVQTKIEGADLSGSKVYGISVWDLKTDRNTKQQNLVITGENEQAIIIDNIEVAQFVYLLLNNEKIRNVIDTIGKKGVLILGRFTEERKAVLDAIRNKLRELGFVPMMFDFEKPTQRDFTETIKTLAGLSRFIIADITNPKSSPLELQATMPDYMIPFVPIIQEDEEPFSMFRDLKQKYGEWVLDPLEYDTAQGLLDVFDKAIIAPANEKAAQLELKKAEQIRTRHVKDYKKG